MIHLAVLLHVQNGLPSYAMNACLVKFAGSPFDILPRFTATNCGVCIKV